MSLKTIGLLLTTFDDVDLSSKAWETLRNFVGPAQRLVVVDGGSKDASVAFWNQQRSMWGDNGCIEVIDKSANGRDLKHLSHALNEGIQHIIQHGYEYVIWIHADMKFENADWIVKLLDRMENDPKMGKLHPFNYNDERTDHGPERPGNACPWIIRTKTLLEVHEWREKTGKRHRTKPSQHLEVFNEGYIGIGGYEDWDLNNVILELGYEVVITPISRVFHQGMGTRGRNDTTYCQRYNAGYYASIWGNAQPKV